MHCLEPALNLGSLNPKIYFMYNKLATSGNNLHLTTSSQVILRAHRSLSGIYCNLEVLHHLEWIIKEELQHIVEIFQLGQIRQIQQIG